MWNSPPCAHTRRMPCTIYMEIFAFAQPSYLCSAEIHQSDNSVDYNGRSSAKIRPIWLHGWPNRSWLDTWLPYHHLPVEFAMHMHSISTGSSWGMLVVVVYLAPTQLTTFTALCCGLWYMQLHLCRYMQLAVLVHCCYLPSIILSGCTTHRHVQCIQRPIKLEYLSDHQQ